MNQELVLVTQVMKTHLFVHQETKEEQRLEHLITNSLRRNKDDKKDKAT